MQQTTPQNHTPQKHKKGKHLKISPDLQHIRNKAPLTQAVKTHPQINKWLTDDYAEEEVIATIQLQNNKSHGQDGIPGETYKALKPWIT